MKQTNKVGENYMEKKVKQTKQKIKDISKEELVFTEKEPCDDCKNKEVKVALPKYTMEELEMAMTLVNKTTQTKDEMVYLINFNNRALNDNKRFGCGKCNVQVLKNIRNLYKRTMEKL